MDRLSRRAPVCRIKLGRAWNGAGGGGEGQIWAGPGVGATENEY